MTLRQQILEYLVRTNGDGGPLHIVVADGNVEEQFVRLSRDRAIAEKDAIGVSIADQLLALDEVERYEAFSGAWYIFGKSMRCEGKWPIRSS